MRCWVKRPVLAGQGSRNWAREGSQVTVSLCPLPSGLGPGGLSKTGSGLPAAETQLRRPAGAGGRGGDGGVGLHAHASAVRREHLALCPGVCSISGHVLSGKITQVPLWLAHGPLGWGS